MDNENQEIKQDNIEESKILEDKESDSQDCEENYTSIGMCLGMCLGMTLGQFIFKNTALGLCIGMCLGLGIGSNIKKK